MIKLILILLLIAFNAQATTFEHFLSAAKIGHKQFGKTVLEKNFKVEIPPNTHYMVTFYDSKNNLYDLEIKTATTKESSKAQLNNYANLLKFAYGDKPSPYAGMITNIEKCPAKYTPKQITETINGKLFQFYSSMAGSHFEYGACSKESAVYSVCTLFFYDQEKLFLSKLKYFVPIHHGNCNEGIRAFMAGLILK